MTSETMATSVPTGEMTAVPASDEIALKENYFKPLQAFVYRKTR